MTRTDRRSSCALPPRPPPPPPYARMGTCNIVETTRCRTSAEVDASASCSRGNSGTGLEERTAGPDEDDVGRVGVVCATLTTAAGEEDSGGFSTTREGGACSSKEGPFFSPPGETVFECASGTDSSGGVDALFCEVLIWDRVRKGQGRVVVCLFAAEQEIVWGCRERGQPQCDKDNGAAPVSNPCVAHCVFSGVLAACNWKVARRIVILAHHIPDLLI